MKQKYVCCNSLKNLLTAILFFIALVFTSNAFAVECTDSVDNDNDGLIDANDLGCQGECGTTYYCGDSTTDRSEEKFLLQPSIMLQMMERLP